MNTASINCTFNPPLGLPDCPMNGFDVLEGMQAVNSLLESIVVLMITSSSNEADRKRRKVITL
ncbi:MAG: hypothetical protein ACRBCI_07940 [Cellvibrionaceae bacterium]